MSRSALGHCQCLIPEATFHPIACGSWWGQWGTSKTALVVFGVPVESLAFLRSEAVPAASVPPAPGRDVVRVFGLHVVVLMSVMSVRRLWTWYLFF